MRTYYELEDYHYEEIKAAGFKKGGEVYCLDFLDHKIVKGIITKFDISIDGCLKFTITYEETHKPKKDKGFWYTSDPQPWTEKHTVSRWMNHVAHSKDELKKILKIFTKQKIEVHESTIEYEKQRIKEFDKM